MGAVLVTLVVVTTLPKEAGAIVAHVVDLLKCSTASACMEVTNSSSGPAIVAQGAGGAGLTSFSTSTSAIVGVTTGTSYASGIEGTDDGNSGSNSGVIGNSSAGHGLTGFSTSGSGVFAQSNALAIEGFSSGAAGVYVQSLGPAGSSAIRALAGTSGIANYVMTGTNAAQGQDVVSIDSLGNQILAGTLTQSGQPPIRTSTSSGNEVMAYGARTSSPTLEDFGEAQLSLGQAYVPLDPTFESTIDLRAKYMVFLSPQGDNRGLYVTGLSKAGFTVHESNGGHSSIVFDYRIVAKPFDSNAVRLAPTTRFSGLVHGGLQLNPPARRQ